MWKLSRIFASGYYREKFDEAYVCITVSALNVCVLALLTLPLSWVISWGIAVFVHELCHYIALRLLGVSILEIRIGWNGVLMCTGPVSPVQELISAAAGPLGGLTLLALCRIFPRLGVCAFLQSLFNLIPLQTLDGGRIVKSILFLCFDVEKACLINSVLQKILWKLVVILLLFVCFRVGFIGIPLAAMLLLRIRKSKISLQRDETNCTI